MTRAALLSLLTVGAALTCLGCTAKRLDVSKSAPSHLDPLYTDESGTVHWRSGDRRLDIQPVEAPAGLSTWQMTMSRGTATARVGPLAAQTTEGNPLELSSAPRWGISQNLGIQWLHMEQATPVGHRIPTAITPGQITTIVVHGADRLSRVTLPVKIGKIELLAMDYGWLMKDPQPFTRNRLMTNFVLAQSATTAVLLGCNQSWRFEIDPAGQLSVTALHRAETVAFFVGIGPAGSWPELIAAYRRGAHPGWTERVDLVHWTQHMDPAQRQRLQALTGRMLVDDWSVIPYDKMSLLLDRLRFLGCDRLALVRHIWQQHGYDVKLPDTWPPAERFGGLDGMQRLGDYCRANGILFGLHENFDDLYRDAPTFDNWALAYHPREWHPDGKPREYTGWYNEATKQRAVRHTPGSAFRAMGRNLALEQQVCPSTIFMDVTSYTDPDPLEGIGVYVGVEENLRIKRDMYLQAADIVAGPALGEGCTEKYLDAVHGANCDLWDVDRWGNKAAPADWEFFPLLDWLAHDRVVFQGVGYPARFGEPTQIPFTARLFEQPFIDNYTSTNILFGHAPMHYVITAGFSVDPLKMATTWWTGVPFHQVVGRQPIESVSTEPDKIHRLTVKYPGSTQVWVNRADKPWQVNGVTLGKYGYLVQAPDFRQRLAIVDGYPLEVVEGKGLLYVDFRGHRRACNGVEADGVVLLRQVDAGLEVIPLAGNTQPARVDISKTGLWHAKGAVRVERVDLTGARTPIQVTGTTVEVPPQPAVDANNLVEAGSRRLHKLVIRPAAQ